MKFSTHIGGYFKDIWQDRREPESMRMLMHMYWGSLLSLSVIILLCIGALSYLWGFSNDTAPTLTSSGSGAAEVVFQKQLHTFITDFSARQGSYDSVRATGPSVSDPYIGTKSSATPSPTQTGPFIILPQ